MKTYVRMITRKELLAIWPDMIIGEDLHWWNQLFLHIQSGNNGFYCPFTPWRLIATLFVPKSTWYQRRVGSWEEP